MTRNKYKEIRVLIVDDEFIPAWQHHNILQEAGVTNCRYECKFQKALDAFAETRPEIIVPDIHLSKDSSRDGFALLKEIRRLCFTKGWPMPYCIFVTGYQVDEARALAQTISGNILLEKPASDKELLSAFDTAIARLPDWRKEYGLADHLKPTIGPADVPNVEDCIGLEEDSSINSGSHFKRWLLKWRGSGKRLARIDSWRDEERLDSVWLPGAGSLGRSIDLLNEFIESSPDRETQIYASYRSIRKSSEDRDCRHLVSNSLPRAILKSVSETHRISLASVIAASPSFEGCHMEPAMFSVETSIGDVHLVLNDIGSGDSGVIINTDSFKSFSALGDFWLHQIHKPDLVAKEVYAGIQHVMLL